MNWLISIEAPDMDGDGNLEGDVLEVEAETEEEAIAKVELPQGWYISNITISTPGEADELSEFEDDV